MNKQDNEENKKTEPLHDLQITDMKAEDTKGGVGACDINDIYVFRSPVTAGGRNVDSLDGHGITYTGLE